MNRVPAASLLTPCRALSLSGKITCLTGTELPFFADQALSFSLSEGCADGRLLGGAFSASCSLTLDNSDGAFTSFRSLWGASVQVKMDTPEGSMPLCVFTVEKTAQQENDCRLTLSGADALGTAFEGVFEDDFSYPLTLGALARQVASQAGFGLSTDFPNASFSIPSRPDWGDITLRQALAYIACAAGCFCLIDREGALRFRPVWQEEDVFLLPAEATLKREYGDEAFGPLTGLAVRCHNAPREAEPLIVLSPSAALSESASLVISDNPLFPYQRAHTQALAEALLSRLQGMKTVRARVHWRGDPQLLPGTRLRIADASGDTADTLVTAQTLTFFQGFSMRTDGLPPARTAAAGRVFTAGGALNAAMLQGSFSGVLLRDGTVSARAIAAGSISAVHLAAQSVTADKLAAGAVSAGALSAVKADIESLEAGELYAGIAAVSRAQITTANILDADIGWADIASLRAASAETARAQIADAKIGFAQIYDLSADTALISQGAGDRLFISRLTVDGAQIQDLLVNRLYVKNSEGTLQALQVDAQTGKVSGGSLLSDRSVDASSILIEHSITARELNVSQIFADQALIRAVKAAHIDVGDLFAAQATVDQLNAMDLTGNRYLRLLVQSRSRNYTQLADPAQADPLSVFDGDLWVKGSGFDTWKSLRSLTWSGAGAYRWEDFGPGVQYVRRDGAWRLVTDTASLLRSQADLRLVSDQIAQRVQKTETDLGGLTAWRQEASLLIRPDAIVETVRESADYQSDLNGRYALQSGISILAAGVEISGGKYVKIKSGGLFSVDSGNFAIDENGNVSLTGQITATSGAIGGWALASSALYSGSGSGYVSLNSNTASDYALWAGAESASSAPFRVKRDGTVYLTKLVALDANNNESTVNLRTAGLWRLDRAVSSMSVANNALTITLYDGTSVNFTKPGVGSVRLTGAGSSSDFSAEAYASGAVPGTDQPAASCYGYLYLSSNTYTRSTTVAVGTSAGSGTVATLSLADYWDAAVAVGEANGGGAVTLSCSWSGSTFTVDASNGASRSTTISCTEASQISFSSEHKATVSVWASDSPSFLFSQVIDASGVYQEGYDEGYAAGWAAAKAKITLVDNVIYGPSNTVDAQMDIYTVTAAGQINSITNPAQGYYYAQGTGYARVNGITVASANFNKSQQFNQ